MKIQIRGLHTSLTPVIEDYVTRKISTLSKFVDDNVVCNIDLIKTTEHHRQGDIFKAEANINIKGEQIHATSEKGDMYEAIDELRDELNRILSSRKSKKSTLFLRGAQKFKDFIRGIRPFKK
jgi:putative sigma-54 modulation protein